MSERSDEDLLTATAVEPEAFGAFYERYEDAVLRFFLTRVFDPELAADLTAETFAAALRASRRFRGGRAPASAWLFGIARKTFAASRRRGAVEDRARRRLAMEPLTLSDDVIEQVMAVAACAGDTPMVNLMSELPAAQRHALAARVIDEREYADIAQQLRCSEAVVRKRVSRALLTMRHRTERA
jgi:RNA polymerase sigma factor (sigma-70 family)